MKRRVKPRVDTFTRALNSDRAWIFEHDYCEGAEIAELLIEPMEPNIIIKEESRIMREDEEREDEEEEGGEDEEEEEENASSLVCLEMREPLENEAKVLALLPQNYNYRFEKCEYVSYENFIAEFRIKEVDTGEKASEWMRDFEGLGFTTWRVRKTFPGSGRINLHKIEFRCQHNTDKRRAGRKSHRRTKDTNCPTILQLTVKKFIRKSQAKRRDDLIADWPCIIYLHHVHNHTIGPDTMPSRQRKRKSELHTVRYMEGPAADENSSPVHQLGSEIEIAAAVGSCLKAIFPDSNQIPSAVDDRLVLDNYIITAVTDETGTLIHLPEEALSACEYCPCVRPCKCACHENCHKPLRVKKPEVREIAVQAGDPDLGVAVVSAENNFIEMLRQVGWVQVQEAPI